MMIFGVALSKSAKGPLLVVGGGVILPKEGSIIGGKCVTTGDVTSEQVTLELKVIQFTMADISREFPITQGRTHWLVAILSLVSCSNIDDNVNGHRKLLKEGFRVLYLCT